MKRLSILFGILLLGLNSSLAETVEVISRFIKEAPIIDGELNDNCWKDIKETGPFYKLGEKTLAVKQTTFKVAHDKENLYLGVVCHEPDMKNIRAREWKRDQGCWQDDCIEIFLDPEGKEAPFHLISNILGMKWDGKVDDKNWNCNPDFTVGCKKEKDRWSMEVAIPFKAITKDTPRRGEVWQFKVARENYAGTGERSDPIEVSCFPESLAKGFSAPKTFADLIFESKNLLVNGSFEEGCNKDGIPNNWELVNEEPANKAKVALDDKNKTEGRYSVMLEGELNVCGSANEKEIGTINLRQKVKVRPDTNYKLAGFIKTEIDDKKGGAYFKLHPLGITRLKLKKSDNFLEYSQVYKTKPDENFLDVSLTLWAGTKRKGRIYADDISLVQLAEIKPQGLYCLTGNSAKYKELNLDTGGAYIYEDGAYLPKGEKGEKGKPIPFSEGVLTSEPEKCVTWYNFIGSSIKPDIPAGRLTVIFDLKKDYFIKQFSLLCNDNSLTYLKLSVKPDTGPEYVPVQIKGKDISSYGGSVPVFGYCLFDKIDSLARYIKVEINGKSGYFPEECGIELKAAQIWGEEKGKHTAQDIKPYRIKDGLVVAKKDISQIVVKPEAPSVLPRPQEMEVTKEMFCLGKDTIIVAGGKGKTLTTARQFQEELKERFNLDLSIKGEDGIGKIKNIILLGEPSNSPLIREINKKENLRVTKDNPGTQGYALEVKNDCIVICGSDEAGTFYGVQSLAQLIEVKAGKVLAHGVRIRDWPYIHHRFPLVGYFSIPSPAEMESYKRLVKALARFKYNAFYVNPAHVRSESKAWHYMEWALDKEATRKYIQYCNDHFIEVVPNVAIINWGLADFDKVAEKKPEEKAADVSGARRCPCPSNPLTYEIAFKAIDELCDIFPGPYINLCLAHEMMPQHGARWNVCEKCKARNLSDEELWLAFVTKILNHFFEKHPDRTPIVMAQHAPFKKVFDKIPDRDRIIIEDYGFDDSKEGIDFLVKHNFKGIVLWYGMKEYNHGKVKDIWGDKIWGTYEANWAASTIDSWARMQFRKLLVAMEQRWSPTYQTPDKDEFPSRLERHLTQFREIVQGHSLPSLEPDRKFSTVDLSKHCNLSFIDKGGSEGGWVNKGTNYDLQYLPTGDQMLGGIPFQIMDPGQNKYTCIKEKAEGIRIDKKLASLIFLHTLTDKAADDEVVGRYRINYKDSVYTYAIIRPGLNIMPWDACPELIEKGSEKQGTIKCFARPVWLGMTESDDGVFLLAYEWLNPYPEKEIVSVDLLPPVGKEISSKVVLISLTGISQDQRDLARWEKIKAKPPLRKETRGVKLDKEPVPLLLEQGQAINKTTFESIDGTIISGPKIVSYLGGIKGILSDNKECYYSWSSPSTIDITFKEPKTICQIQIRGRFGLYYTLFRTDYKLELSLDGKEWKVVGENKGITAEEDGDIIHVFTPALTKYIKITVDGMKAEEGMYVPGISYIKIYEIKE